MKEEMYIRVTVRKRNGESVTTRSFWGNADKAIIGNYVSIEEDDGSWTQSWEVIAVHGKPITKKVAIQNSHLHTKQRKASDI